MLEPILSVIVPVYKIKKEYLDQCVNSILNQPLYDIELILVDDGSPDKSGEFCEEYKINDERVKVFHKCNGGSSSARNYGLKYVSGKWVAFLDADDWYDEKLFSEVLQPNKYDGYDVIMFSGCREYVGQSLLEPQMYEDETIFNTKERLESLQIRMLSIGGKDSNSYILSNTATKLFKREFLIQNQLSYDSTIKFDEDSLFNLKVYENAKSLIFLNRHYHHYRSVSNSKVNQYRKNIDKEQIELLQTFEEFKNDKLKGEDFQKAIYLRSLASLQMCFFQKFYNNNYDGENPRKAFVKYLKESPYKEALLNLNHRDLNNHFALKFYCFKYHLFALLKFIDKVYRKKNKLKLYL